MGLDLWPELELKLKRINIPGVLDVINLLRR